MKFLYKKVSKEQHRGIWELIVIGTVLLVSSIAFGAELEIMREGIAKAIDSDKVLYTENHVILLDSEGLNRKITTTYTSASNQVIARMISDFKDSKVVADVTFEDLRFSTVYHQNVDVEKKTVNLSLVTADGKVENQKTDLTNDMIAGQGFDNYAKMNFDLEKKREIRFLVLNKLDYFSFVVSPLEMATKTEKQFRLNIDSMLLKYLVGPIDVTYNTKDKMLTSYKGISNLLNESKDSQDVLITYHSVESPVEKPRK